MSELSDAPEASDITEAVRGKADLVHLVFTYRCPAGHEERIGCGFGVEGPLELRAKRLYIASPFMVRCQVCDQLAAHVSFAGHDKEEFEPRPPEPGTRYFRVPDEGPRAQLFGSVVFSGVIRTAPPHPAPPPAEVA